MFSLRCCKDEVAVVEVIIHHIRWRINIIEGYLYCLLKSYKKTQKYYCFNQ